ncbi:MAG TPA: hypothetical protein VH040_13905 [Usitatibacter sp.]|jgi:hypothetical protein|nr:hypothetical protein [Usitatibacter sp.]
MKWPLLVPLAWCLLSVAHAADRPCTRPDIANAQRSIDAIVTWPQLRKAWADYRQCDSGEIADMYTDALLRVAVSWKNSEQLANDAEKDPNYKAFVVAHLKSPAAKDDLPSIKSRVASMCPKGHDAFCAELSESLKPAAAPSLPPLNLEPLRLETIKPTETSPGAPK